MIDNIVNLSQQLIAIKSANTCLNLMLSKLGRFTIERFEKNGVKSAFIFYFRHILAIFSWNNVEVPIEQDFKFFRTSDRVIN